MPKKKKYPRFVVTRDSGSSVSSHSSDCEIGTYEGRCYCSETYSVWYTLYDCKTKSEVCTFSERKQALSIRDLLNKNPKLKRKFQKKDIFGPEIQLQCKKHKYYGLKKPTNLCETCFEGWSYCKEERKQHRKDKLRVWNDYGPFGSMKDGRLIS